MTKFVGLISAKGGVGKTTTAINLASALYFFRRRVIALDANFANPDVGIQLGIPNMPNTLHSALKGKHHIRETVHKHPSGLWVVPGSLSYKEAREAKRENLVNVIYGLMGTAEAVIIDSTPGMGADTEAVIKACDYVIVVTTPDICSVGNSLKIVKLAEELGVHVLGIVVNKKNNEDYEMTEQNISEFLGKPVIGLIPESRSIRNTLNQKRPVVAAYPNSRAGIGYKKLAGILIGEKYVESLPPVEEEDIFKRFLKNLGFRK